ncbi:MAG: hypothetical protein K0S61_1654 [Anaerocolumna sp.]|jgi:uncharacterized membrane protein|nr:hypothetical protein [Anaerocolumna sp.]
MTRQSFFEELNQLLEDISLEEKEEAIRFYENYFDDAGKENEEAILKELVSPQKVAGSIKQSINTNEGDQVEQGYFTEQGYEDGYNNLNRQEISVPENQGVKEDSLYIDDYTSNKASNKESSKESSNKENSNKENNYESNNRESNYGSSNNRRTGTYQNTTDSKYYDRNFEQSKRKPNILLIILLGIILLPIGLPIVITIITLMFSVAVTVISVWIAFAITSIAMLISAVIVIGISLFQLFTIPALGFLLAGTGLIIFGVGILFLLVTIWMTRTVLPFLFNSIISLIKLPFRNRRALA